MRLGLISLLVAAGLVPQAFRAGTHTVSIYATVVDGDRRLVPNLTKDDFVVYDDGKRQPLTVFQNEVQPISIVIMLDRSSSMLANFDLVRDAAVQFVSDLLPDDRARVGSFSNRVQIDPPDFTSDRDELIRILHANLQEPGPTPLWNAAFAAMNALAHQSGRRVVLLFTDGKNQPGELGQTTTLSDVIRRSQADDIMVYGIGLGEACGSPSDDSQLRAQRGGGGGRGVPGRGGAGRGRPGSGRNGPLPHDGRIGGRPGVDVLGGSGRGGDTRGPGAGELFGAASCKASGPDPGLKLLADDGGGGYFELHGTDNLTAALARVAEELHHQYTLGFTAAAIDGKVHTLDVRVDRSNMTVRARKKYLAAESQ